MPTLPATLTHLSGVEMLFATGRRLYSARWPLDLHNVVQNHFSSVGITDDIVWGFLGLDCVEGEIEPLSLTNTPGRRIYITHAALARGRSPYRDVERLLATALELIPRQSQDGTSTLLIWYGDQSWLVAPLKRAGFKVSERIEFLVLDRLQKRTLPEPTARADICFRPARFQDLTCIAELDARVFSPVWYITNEQLREMCFSHHVWVVEKNSKIVGYSALHIGNHEDEKWGHLARLAVAVVRQGRGLGRILLLNTLHFAQAHGATTITLNTQTNNTKARQLYQSVGFRRTGKIIPVLTQIKDEE